MAIARPVVARARALYTFSLQGPVVDLLLLENMSDSLDADLDVTEELLPTDK